VTSPGPGPLRRRLGVRRAGGSVASPRRRGSAAPCHRVCRAGGWGFVAPAGLPCRRVCRAGGWGFVAPAGLSCPAGLPRRRPGVRRAGGSVVPVGSPCRWPGSVPRSRVSRHSTGCRRRMAIGSALARVSRHSGGEGCRVLRYSGSAPGARGRPCAACAGPGFYAPGAGGAGPGVRAFGVSTRRPGAPSENDASWAGVRGGGRAYPSGSRASTRARTGAGCGWRAAPESRSSGSR